MAHEARAVPINSTAGLLAVAREVKRTRTPRIIEENGEELARIVPPKPRTRSRLPRGNRTSADDPIWRIIGIADSGEPSNISERVDEYLTEAELAKDHRV